MTFIFFTADGQFIETEATMDCISVSGPPNTKSSKKAKTLPRKILWKPIFDDVFAAGIIHDQHIAAGHCVVPLGIRLIWER
jgi:hypothetical protein